MIPGLQHGARLAGPLSPSAINARIDRVRDGVIQGGPQGPADLRSLLSNLKQGNNGTVYANFDVPRYGRSAQTGDPDYTAAVLAAAGRVPPSNARQAMRDAYADFSPEGQAAAKNAYQRTFIPSPRAGATRPAIIEDSFNVLGQRANRYAQDLFTPIDDKHANLQLLERAGGALAAHRPDLAEEIGETVRHVRTGSIKNPGEAVEITVEPGEIGVNRNEVSYVEDFGDQGTPDPTEVLTTAPRVALGRGLDGDSTIEVIENRPEEAEPYQGIMWLEEPRQRYSPGPEELAATRRTLGIASGADLNENAPVKGGRLREDGDTKNVYDKGRQFVGVGPYNDDPTATRFNVTGFGSGAIDALEAAMKQGDQSRAAAILGKTRNYAIPAADYRLGKYRIADEGDSHMVRLPNGSVLPVAPGLEGEFVPENVWRAIVNQETELRTVDRQSLHATDESGAFLLLDKDDLPRTFYPLKGDDGASAKVTGRLDSKYRQDRNKIHADLGAALRDLHGIELAPLRLQNVHEGLAYGGIYGVRGEAPGTHWLEQTQDEARNVRIPELSGLGGRGKGNPTIASQDQVDGALRHAIRLMNTELQDSALPQERRQELLMARDRAIGGISEENRDPEAVARRAGAAIAREVATREAVAQMETQARAIRGDDGALARLSSQDQEKVTRLREVHQQQAAALPATMENVLARQPGVAEELPARRPAPRPGATVSWPLPQGTSPGDAVRPPYVRVPEAPDRGPDFRPTAVTIAEGTRPTQDFDGHGIKPEDLAAVGGVPAPQGYGGGPRRAIFPAVRSPQATDSARPRALDRPGEEIFIRGAETALPPLGQGAEDGSAALAAVEAEVRRRMAEPQGRQAAGEAVLPG